MCYTQLTHIRVTAAVELYHSRRLLLATAQSNCNCQNFICSGSGHDDQNGGVWKECECSEERCLLGQHKYFTESFEGEITLYRSGRWDCKPVLTERCIVCVVLNGESSFQDDVVMRKLKFGKLLLAQWVLDTKFFGILVFCCHRCLIFWAIWMEGECVTGMSKGHAPTVQSPI